MVKPDRPSRGGGAALTRLLTSGHILFSYWVFLNMSGQPQHEEVPTERYRMEPGRKGGRQGHLRTECKWMERVAAAASHQRSPPPPPQWDSCEHCFRGSNLGPHRGYTEVTDQFQSQVPSQKSMVFSSCSSSLKTCHPKAGGASVRRIRSVI